MKRIIIVMILFCLSVIFISCNNTKNDESNYEQKNISTETDVNKNDNDINEQTGQNSKSDSEDNSDVQSDQNNESDSSGENNDGEKTTIIEDEPLRIKDLKTKNGNFEYIDYAKNLGFHYYANQFFSSGLYGYPIGLMPSEYTMDIYTTKGLFYLPYEGNPTEYSDVKTDKLFRIDWYHNHTESYVEDHPYEYMEEYEDTYIVIIYKIDDVYYGYLILSVEHKIVNQNENYTDRVVEGTFVEIYVEEVANKLFDLEYDDLKKVTKSLLDTKILLEISDYSNNKEITDGLYKLKNLAKADGTYLRLTTTTSDYFYFKNKKFVYEDSCLGEITDDFTIDTSLLVNTSEDCDIDLAALSKAKVKVLVFNYSGNTCVVFYYKGCFYVGEKCKEFHSGLEQMPSVNYGTNYGTETNFRIIITHLYKLEKVDYQKIQVDLGIDYIVSNPFSSIIIDKIDKSIIIAKELIEDNSIVIPVLSSYVYCTYQKDGEDIKIDSSMEPYFTPDLLLNCIVIDASIDVNYSFKTKLLYKFIPSNNGLTEREKHIIARTYVNNNTTDIENPYLFVEYYGRYNGGYVVYITSNYYVYEKKDTIITIDNYIFTYQDENQLLFIKYNDVFTLSDAFNEEKLTSQDISDIYQKYTFNTGNTGELVFYKPIIYLYPTEEMDLTIKFKDPSRLITTYPVYKDGWNIHVSVDSTITIDNRSYYALYYDEIGNFVATFDEGFYVTKENAITFLEESLDEMGFSNREANEFIMYWLPILEANGESLVYFEQTEERNNECPLEMSVNPDTYLRVIIHIKKCNGEVDIKKQELKKTLRIGFTLVEWGGTIY